MCRGSPPAVGGACEPGVLLWDRPHGRARGSLWCKASLPRVRVAATVTLMGGVDNIVVNVYSGLIIHPLWMTQLHT